LPQDKLLSSHNKYNKNITTSEIVDKYLKDFLRLPILYKFNGFEIRDINQQDVHVSYIDSFIFNFSDEIFLWMQSVEDNDESKISGKNQNFTHPLDKYEIMQELTHIADIDDFDAKNENEIFIRFPKETKTIIEKCKNIIENYYKHWESIVPKYFINKSFFISWYFKEMGSSEWKDWKEIEDILDKK
jgi:hypothetical protein